MTSLNDPREASLQPHNDDATSQYVTRLAAELMARGLATTTRVGHMVTARNRALDPPADDQRARLLSPGLIQPVVCGPHADTGEIWWFWVWSGLTPDDPPEYEPLCPAEEIRTAARRIAAVLAVMPSPGRS